MSKQVSISANIAWLIMHRKIRPWKQSARALSIWLCFKFAANAFAQDLPAENVDHAGIISRWDEKSLARGRSLFQLACAPCHGTNGVQTINPQARPFAAEKFKNGNEPYSLFKTITLGFKD